MAPSTPWLPLALGAALLAFLGTAGCGAKGREPAQQAAAEKAAPPIVLGAQDVATARLSAADAGVVLTGSLQPAWIVSVKAQVPGTVEGIRGD
ncbi:MAG: hypothetical protein IRZ00_20565, partial [Gemmatimonadetes bacterium]|nr:hypothetical protein [Gemmatimonadota bacterium]